MTYRISKDFAFSASHQLHGLPDGHPCTRLHGHNYRVRVVVSANQLNSLDMVCDYANLDPLGDWIRDNLDHRHLNDVFTDANLTAEYLACCLLSVTDTQCLLPDSRSLAVGVSETPKTWAWCE